MSDLTDTIRIRFDGSAAVADDEGTEIVPEQAPWPKDDVLIVSDYMGGRMIATSEKLAQQMQERDQINEGDNAFGVYQAAGMMALMLRGYKGKAVRGGIEISDDPETRFDQILDYMPTYVLMYGVAEITRRATGNFLPAPTRNASRTA